MVYLVSKNKVLFNTDLYKTIPFDQALSILLPLKEVQLDTETSGSILKIKI